MSLRYCCLERSEKLMCPWWYSPYFYTCILVRSALDVSRTHGASKRSYHKNLTRSMSPGAIAGLGNSLAMGGWNGAIATNAGGSTARSAASCASIATLSPSSWKPPVSRSSLRLSLFAAALHLSFFTATLRLSLLVAALHVSLFASYLRVSLFVAAFRVSVFVTALLVSSLLLLPLSRAAYKPVCFASERLSPLESRVICCSSQDA